MRAALTRDGASAQGRNLTAAIWHATLIVALDFLRVARGESATCDITDTRTALIQAASVFAVFGAVRLAALRARRAKE